MKHVHKAFRQCSVLKATTGDENAKGVGHLESKSAQRLVLLKLHILLSSKCL